MRRCPAVAPTVSPTVRTVLATLRAAVSDESPTFPQPDPAWDRVYAIARHHHLVPLIHEALAASDRTPPILENMRRDLRENAKRNLHATMRLHRVHAALSDAGVDSIPYKGPVLAGACYGGLHRRTFFDVDILVPPSAIEDAGRVLCRQGYEPDDTFRTVRALGPTAPLFSDPVECTFRHPGTGAVIELRWRLGAREDTLSLSFSELWRRRSTLPVAGQELPVLSPEDRLVILAVHGTKHAWRRLGWLADIGMLIREDDSRASEICWSTVVSRAEAWGVKLPLAIAVILVTALFDVTVPERVRDALRTPRATALAQWVLTRFTATPLAQPDGFEVALYNAVAVDSRRTVPLFALRKVFQPRRLDYQAMPLPRAYWPVYLLTRGFRTIISLARRLRSRGDLMRSTGRSRARRLRSFFNK